MSLHKWLEGVKEWVMGFLSSVWSIQSFNILPVLEIRMASCISQPPPLCVLINTDFLTLYSSLLFLSLISLQVFHFAGVVGPHTKPDFHNNHSGVHCMGHSGPPAQQVWAPGSQGVLHKEAAGLSLVSQVCMKPSGQGAHLGELLQSSLCPHLELSETYGFHC